MSKMIVVEGPDRVGKQTQTKLLQEYITRTGLGAIVVEVPIRSAVTYRIIYWMLKNGLAKKFPKVFQCFQFLNRKIFQIFALPGLERMYDVIIMDRWSLSTVVYGAAEGISEEFTTRLAKWLRAPDYTFVLLGQAYPHEAEDTYEADFYLQDRVRVGYSQWAAEHQDISTLINCRDERCEISKNIRSILEIKRIIPRS